MANLHIGGLDFYYDTVGTGERIVLTHGSWGDGTSWALVVPELAKHYEVVVWDRRGHSRSEDGPGGMRQDAVDLVRLLETLGGPAHLVASSFGGTVALKMVELAPELAVSVTVHEPDLLGILEPSGSVGELLADEIRHNDVLVEIIKQGRHADAAEYFFDNMAVGPGAWEGLPRVARDTFISNADTFLQDSLDSFDPEPVDLAALEDSGVPILVTTGTKSPPLLLEVARSLESRLASARFETIDGAGHIPYRTHPHEWARKVLDFLKGH